MRKSTRIVKRIFALLLVVLMSINSFGAVVSDNDGSAFITKAEFDSLKNDFQSQIDQYNTSIDSKIDGAIASYLAGINVAKTTNKSLLVKNWTEGVQAINGSIANTFQYPNVSGNIGGFEWRYAFGGSTTRSSLTLPPWQYTGTNLESSGGTVGTLPYSPNTKLLWFYGGFSYRNTTKTEHYRNLVENVVIGSTLNTDNMTWAGRATNVTETWTLSKLLKYEYIYYNSSDQEGLNHDPGYLEDQYTNYFYLCNILNLNKPGYVPSFVDKTNPLWVPKVNWVSLTSTGATKQTKNWNVGDCISVSAIPTIEYEKNSDGKQFIYEHIINYKNDTAWEVAAKNVTNYVKDTTNNTLGTAGWTSEVETNGEMDGEWSGFESGESTKVYSTTRGNSSFRGIKTDQDVYLIDQNPDSSHSTNNKSIPVIGLLGTYNSNQIYQFTKGDVVDEDGVRLNPVYLHQGLPIMQVKEDEIIEWEPTFKDIKVSGMSGVNECKIILSYVPFTNKTTISNTNDYVKMDGITKGSFATTSSKKVKIKFEADRNSYVYAKWVPNTTDSTIDSTHWEATLDIENCNTYKSTKE